MSTPISSREDARNLVQQISIKRGYIHQDDRDKLSALDRDAYLLWSTALENVQGQLGSAVVT